MTIELVADDGQRRRIPRGWVVLTLVLASWGAVSIIGCAVWSLLTMFG